MGRPACCLLGPAGIGKTYELELLREHEHASGWDVLPVVRLAEIATSADRLDERLSRLAASITPRTSIYLDALDEAMVGLDAAGRILASWVDHELGPRKPLMRISCRSAVWLRAIEAALSRVYGEGSVSIVSLQPLSDPDVVRAASCEGIDGNSFVDQVRRSTASVFAHHPLTLRMLLRLFRRDGRLPNGRRDLFELAVEHLADEREDRRELGLVPAVPPGDVLEAAERLACFSVLSGRAAFDSGEDPVTSSIGRHELVGLTSAHRRLDDDLLRAVRHSGLCEGEGPHRFRFIHRQVAEYLAGRRLAKLPTHQSKSLLGSSLGWEFGIAGPLRETAAFAAADNPELAMWVAEADPEVVGLSDVDDVVRRRSVVRLLDRFRRHELTDAVMEGEDFPLAGFACTGLEEILRPALKERGPDCEDVLAFAIALVKSLGLAGLHEDLAGLALDAQAPMRSRVSAGYVLAGSGAEPVRRRLLPLSLGVPEDRKQELKGVALQCCWPDHLSTSDLLGALQERSSRNSYGPYFHFLCKLDDSGFCAADDLVGGLVWAKSGFEAESISGPLARLRQKIAHKALDEIHLPGIAEALVDLLLESSLGGSSSPLDVLLPATPAGRTPQEPPLAGRREARRIVLDRLALRAREDRELLHVFGCTPGLRAGEDFAWLLEQACDRSRSRSQRDNFAVLASRLPTPEDHEAVEKWLALRAYEPVKSKIQYSTFIELDSDEAREARGRHGGRQPATKAEPSDQPEMFLLGSLDRLLELDSPPDPRLFRDLSQSLGRIDASSRDQDTAWLGRVRKRQAVGEDIRARLTGAAKRLLVDPPDEPETARLASWDECSAGYSSAVQMVFERDRSWLEGMSDEWWGRWCPIFIGGLRMNFVGEAEEIRTGVFALLHGRAAERVRDGMLKLAKSRHQETPYAMQSLLGLCRAVDDDVLDGGLARLLEERDIGPIQVRYVTRFLIGRTPDRALSLCRTCLGLATGEESDDFAVEVASALLDSWRPEAWALAISFLHLRSDLARRVLGKFAQAKALEGPRVLGVRPGYSAEQVGELVDILLEHYPPESDPEHDGPVSWTDEDEAARLLRDCIDWLWGQTSCAAVEALRTLERRFGAKHHWLRRPRSYVERAHRRSQWEPIPPERVAILLQDASRKLIRTGRDAVEGIAEAIRQYEYGLRHASPPDLEDIWDTAGTSEGWSPRPKKEERVSDKLCKAIHEYFRDHAVVAGREVQLRRRIVPRDQDGESGSDADILVVALAGGATGRTGISIPIEVKRSDNKEARTGLRQQLVDRYMSQIGTDFGVFVVVWFEAPGLPKSHKPVWPDIETARNELRSQAEDANAEVSGRGGRVLSMVIDATLR